MQSPSPRAYQCPGPSETYCLLEGMGGGGGIMNSKGIFNIGRWGWEGSKERGHHLGLVTWETRDRISHQ